ncbi:hypothetical protein MDAP_000930 [Mitosporidium daphniae]
MRQCGGHLQVSSPFQNKSHHLGGRYSPLGGFCTQHFIRSYCWRFFKRSSPPTESPDHLGDTKPKGSRLALGPPIERLIIRSRMTADTDLARLASKTIAALTYGFLGVTVMGTLGIDTTPIITGIGVTGFTIGFALKEIATNFLSGVLLMFEKPFEKGCHLKIHGGGGGIEGTVTAIDLRHVHLKLENSEAIVLVPSSVVYSNPLSVTKRNH